MDRNEVYHRLLNTTRWQRLRCDALHRQPLCERCESKGLYTQATEVHHITPVQKGTTVREMETLAYNPANLMSLCHNCHKEIHWEMKSRSGQTVRQAQAARLADFCTKFGLPAPDSDARMAETKGGEG